MDCPSNPFENLIQSFKSVCSALEANAEFDLMNIEKQCKEEMVESGKIFKRFNELTSGISETCKEVLNYNEVLHILSKKTNVEAAINVPYEIHSDIVNSVSALYNMSVPEIAACDKKLISEKNKQLLSDLITECDKNMYDMKDIQSALVDAKATLK